MQEYFTLIAKCIIIYFVIILAMRIMGKREVGELSVFDIVIYLSVYLTQQYDMKRKKVSGNHWCRSQHWRYYKLCFHGYH